MKIKHTTFRTCVLFLVATHVIPSQARTKDEVVAAWKSQFKNLKSLYCKSQYTRGFVKSGVDAVAPKDLPVWNLTFALQDKMYFSEVRLPSGPGLLSALSMAYNGKYYQATSEEDGLVREKRWTKSKKIEFPYQGDMPILKQFEFALLDGDERSIKTLQDPSTWEQVSERITKVEPGTRDGRDVTVVTLSIPKRRMAYEVSVSEDSMVPLYWKTVGLHGPLDVYNEVIVSNPVTLLGPGSTFVFPATIIDREIRYDEIFDENHFVTDVKTLKVNKTVPNEIFTFPVEQASSLFDEDVEEARIQANEKKKK